jgi:hypothetical protein
MREKGRRKKRFGSVYVFWYKNNAQKRQCGQKNGRFSLYKKEGVSVYFF